MNQFPPFELLIATTNPGKMLEIQRAFSDLPLMLRSLDEFPDIALVEETGTTYEENALLKALNYAEQTRRWALADDSGLEVIGLDGLPGVRSARYGGANASDGERTQKLIRELDGKAFHKRSARFVCCVAFAGWKARDPSRVLGKPRLLNLSRGECTGHIAKSSRGTHGFGYDPVFIPKGYDATFAELPSQVKRLISHRAHAISDMRAFLKHWLAQT